MYVGHAEFGVGIRYLVIGLKRLHTHTQTGPTSLEDGGNVNSQRAFMLHVF